LGRAHDLLTDRVQQQMQIAYVNVVDANRRWPSRRKPHLVEDKLPVGSTRRVHKHALESRYPPNMTAAIRYQPVYAAWCASPQPCLAMYAEHAALLRANNYLGLARTHPHSMKFSKPRTINEI
jgi:hypothetical protein